MKKKLAIATSAVLLAASALSMVGCSENAADLAPDYAGKYSAKLETLSFLSQDKNYTFSSLSENGLLVLSDTANSMYWLYNLTDKEYVISASTLPITQLDEGLYYTVEYDSNSIARYTLCTKQGIYANLSYVEGSTANGVFTEKTTGNRTYVNVNGKVVTESNHFLPIVTYGASEFVDGYYMKNSSLFDENGKYVKSLASLLLEANIPADANIIGSFAIDDRVFTQYSLELPADAAEYTYAKDGTKYDLVTISYEPKSDKLRTINDFDYYINSLIQENDDNVVLSVYKITDQTIGATPFIQSFDKKGDVAVDIQALVPGAISYTWDENYVYIKDLAGFTYIYKGAKLVRTVNQDLQYLGKLAYKYSGNTLHLYNVEDKSYYSRIENVANCGVTADGRLWYQVTTVGINEIYTYDVSNRSATLLRTIGDTQSVSSMTANYMLIRDYVDGTYSYVYSFYFFDASLNNIMGATTYDVTTLSTEDATYYFIETKSSSDVYSYYLLTTTARAEK